MDVLSLWLSFASTQASWWPHVLSILNTGPLQSPPQFWGPNKKKTRAWWFCGQTTKTVHLRWAASDLLDVNACATSRQALMPSNYLRSWFLTAYLTCHCLPTWLRQYRLHLPSPCTLDLCAPCGLPITPCGLLVPRSKPTRVHCCFTSSVHPHEPFACP